MEENGWKWSLWENKLPHRRHMKCLREDTISDCQSGNVGRSDPNISPASGTCKEIATLPGGARKDISFFRFAVFFFPLFFALNCNPFAPAYDEDGLADVNLLGDPTQLEGFFTLFKNAYELRDSTLYGRLFTSDFTFTYFDFDRGQEISWDRATEVNSTYNLFQSVRLINLDWNFFTQLDTTEVEAFVIRNFNLFIEQDDQTAFSGAGRARFRLRREAPGTPWMAYFWFDDSDF